MHGIWRKQAIRHVADLFLATLCAMQALDADNLMLIAGYIALGIAPPLARRWQIEIRQRMEEIDGTARYF